MKRLLTLLLALVGLTATVVAEDYGIQIGTVKVTSDNYTNISSAGGFSAVTSGTVTYDPETRMLTLSNACISGYHALSFTGNNEGYTLRLAPGTTNVVTATNGPALHTTKPLTISGGGTLVLMSDGHCGIYAEYQSTSDYTLSIEGSTVLASGRWGIAGYSEYGTLNIDKSIVSGTGAVGSVCDWKAVTLTGTVLYQPDGAAWNETAHSVCDGEGRPVTTTVTYVPSTGSGQEYVPNPALGDVNANGIVTLADVTALVNQILGNGGQQQVEHEYVDLGLPSGTRWAMCNIGATNPEDEGDYFAWGETVPYGGEDPSNLQNYAYDQTYTKTIYNWATYKYCKGSETTMTKYCDKSSCGYNGFTDNLTELEPEDDAAYVNWGSKWRMPSEAQITELKNNTTVESTTLNGKSVFKVTSNINGRSLYLPSTGCREGDSITDGANIFWSRTYVENWGYGGRVLKLFSSWINDNTMSKRYKGYPIRPVRNQ